MAFQHLSSEEVRKIWKAAMEANLGAPGNDQALVQGIDNVYVGLITPPAGNVGARMLAMLGSMNEVRNLKSGEVPLIGWLNNAVLLAYGTDQERVFAAALEEVQDGGTAPPAAVQPATDAALAGMQLEAKIGGEDETLSVDFLRRGALAAQSVVLLKIHRHFSGQPDYLAGDVPSLGLGTGWFLAPGLIMTNHHVIQARKPGETPPTPEDFNKQSCSAISRFDFFAEGSPVVESSGAALVASDPDLDFALLRLAGAAPARPPFRLRTQVLSKPAETALGLRVNVLQHPNGSPMRIGFRDNFVVRGDAMSLSYLTDTAFGSSGAPVCDDAWHVAALHRGYRPLAGRKIQLRGTPIRSENYGVPITAILKHLQQENEAVHQEIHAGQQALGPHA